MTIIDRTVDLDATVTHIVRVHNFAEDGGLLPEADLRTLRIAASIVDELRDSPE